MSRRSLGLLFLFLLITGVAGYGLFEARRLIEGPEITISTPLNGSATSSRAILVSGVAQNISFLTINDKPSFTDEAGRFSELLSIPPGATVLTVAAIDRFGRRTSKSVSIRVLNYCSLNA